jgi:hypothetical protein
LVSISSILGSFPPASLASADLCRFLTRLLNRRSAEELASIRSFVENQSLPGYPASLSPLLVELIETMGRDGVDPSTLDPEQIEELLGRRDLQRRLDTRMPLQRVPLRPGVPVSTEIRNMLGGHLHTVHGVGAKLMLVSAVEVVHLEGLGWASPRQPGVARAMQAPEAEVIRLAWAAVEECFGWGTPALDKWSARFVSIASRSNLPAEEVSDFLREMPQLERLSLWRVLIEHNRDLELSDAHRPGSKGLQERLRSAGLELEEAVLRLLLPVVRRAYQGCAVNPHVEKGLCPVAPWDLENYLKRVDVVPATRDRLKGFCAEEIEAMLRELAAVERSGFDASIEEQLRRDLRGLRDGLVRRRYRLDVSSLLGVDPLIYTEALIQTGCDRGAIERELKNLVDEAHRVSQAQGTGLLENVVQGKDMAHQVSLNLNTRVQNVAVETATGTVEFEAENPFHGRSDEEKASDEKEVITRLPTMENPFKQPGMKDLPPLPKPPRRTRPRTETKIELPPMPSVPSHRPSSGSARKSPTEEFESIPMPEIPPQRQAPRLRRKSPTEEFESIPLPKVPDRKALPVTKERPALNPQDFDELPDVQLEKTPTAGPLVTPSQAVEFYKKAFKELQVMERDLLERGPWQEATERVKRLAAETSEITLALGPAARSGDQDFNLALNKVRVVESYLKRILPLLEDPDLLKLVD